MITRTVLDISKKLFGGLRLVVGRSIPSSERKEAVGFCERILSGWAGRPEIGSGNSDFQTVSELLILEGHLEAIFGLPVDGDELPEVLHLLKNGEPMKNIVGWIRRSPERESAAQELMDSQWRR